VECIPVYYKSDGKAYPFNLHDDVLRQLPYLKKKFLRYDQYAGKSIDEIFTSEELEKAKVLTVNESRTCVFYNNGKGGFTMQALPVRAQFSPVYSILATDINNDGIKDLFLGGNFYGLKPEVGRYDANYGVTLLGSKAHQFGYMPPKESGLFITGEVRDVALVKTPGGADIVMARNNNSLQIFKRLR
jgi:hypothetical protein